jgi:hypothetical protein
MKKYSFLLEQKKFCDWLNIFAALLNLHLSCFKVMKFGLFPGRYLHSVYNAHDQEG